jgi:hypothetical protein
MDGYDDDDDDRSDCSNLDRIDLCNIQLKKHFQIFETIPLVEVLILNDIPNSIGSIDYYFLKNRLKDRDDGGSFT